MIYFIVFVISIFFANIAENTLKRKETILCVIFSFIPIMLLSLLAGIRDVTIGIDTSYYPVTAWEITDCNSLSKEWLSLSFYLEPLYILLAYLTHFIYNDFNFFLWITHFIIIVCFYIAFIRMRHLAPMWFMMFLFCFLYYNTSINISRQSLAVAFGILGYSFLERKNLKMFLICIVIGFLFHKSCLFALLLIPIMYMPRRINKYIIVSLIVAFFAYSFLIVQFSMIEGFEKVGIYQIGGEMNATFSISEFIIRVAFLMIIYFTLNKYNRDFRMNILTLFICELILNLFQMRSEFMGRIGYYIFILYLVYIPYVLRNCSREKRFILSCFIICLSIFNWWYVYIHSEAGQTFPYTSKILNNLLL